MTYRERLRREQPEKLSSCYIGGCYGCPGRYWKGAPESNFDPVEGDHGCSGACTACWDSEIPKTESIIDNDISDVLVISADLSKENHESCLMVAKHSKASVTVLKTFYGKEAEELYLKLTQ